MRFLEIRKCVILRKTQNQGKFMSAIQKNRNLQSRQMGKTLPIQQFWADAHQQAVVVGRSQNQLYAGAGNQSLGWTECFFTDCAWYWLIYSNAYHQRSTNIQQNWGTQTQLDEALMPEDQIQPEKRDDWREVQHYIKAWTKRLTG